MSLAQLLWKENADLAHASLHHPFVCGLQAGTLSRQNFQSYIAQDAYFLEAFARAYALALARCPDLQGLRDFFELLSGVLEELRLHEGYAASWGVELVGMSPAQATLAYIDFLLAMAALKSVGETCAAMTPCMRLYAFLGQSLAVTPLADGHPYVDWIRTYSSADFEVLASRLEGLLDRYADDRLAIRTAYRRAMQLELAFFEAQLPEI